MIDPKVVAKVAADYTAAWNSKSAEAVASFYAEDGQIIINKGEPWSGRARVQDMAAGFYADALLPQDAAQVAATRCPTPQTAAHSFKPPFWKLETEMRPNGSPVCQRALITTDGILAHMPDCEAGKASLVAAAASTSRHKFTCFKLVSNAPTTRWFTRQLS